MAAGAAAAVALRDDHPTAPNGGWSGWQQFGAPDDRLRTLVTRVNADGRSEAFGIAGDDTHSHDVQLRGGWGRRLQVEAADDRLRTLTVHRAADPQLAALGP